MLNVPFGALVVVRPRADAAGNPLRVQEHAEIHGRVMAADWSEPRAWNDWLLRRWKDGSIEVQPAPAKDGE